METVMIRGRRTFSIALMYLVENHLTTWIPKKHFCRPPRAVAKGYAFLEAGLTMNTVTVLCIGPSDNLSKVCKVI